MILLITAYSLSASVVSKAKTAIHTAVSPNSSIGGRCYSNRQGFWEGHARGTGAVSVYHHVDKPAIMRRRCADEARPFWQPSS
jgi:hypothetical protein